MQAQRLGSRYLLTELIGRGAMGRVYRATTADGGEAVAVKVLRDDLGADPDLVHRFLTEGRLLKSVDHPNVVRIRDLVAEGDRLAIVMDLVDGGDLRRAVAVPCSEVHAARIVSGITRGLAAVHLAGIVHRDLKPENVLVERRSDGAGRARIADFGVSRFSSSTTTHTKGMTGTVGYIAPEIARGEPATAAGDVYALGVILYELCVGHGPFQAEHPLALIRAHAEDPVPRPDEMSEPMWALIDTLLAKDPAVRPTAEDVATSLDALVVELADDEGVDGELASGEGVASGWFAAPAPATGALTAFDPVSTQLPAPGAPDGVATGEAPATLLQASVGEEAAAGSSTLPPQPAVPPQQPAPSIPPMPVLPPAPPGPGPRTRRRTLALAAVGGVLLAGAAVAMTATSSLRTDRTAALGNGGPVRHDAPVLVPGTSADPQAAPTSSSSSPSSSNTPVRRVAAAPAVPPAPAPLTVETRTRTHTVTSTATAPVVVVPPPAHAVRTTTETVTSTRTRVRPATATESARTTSSTADPVPATVPLYRYWNAAIGDHFYTTNYAELGGGKSGYVLEGVQANVFAQSAKGAVPLYRYWNAAIGDHFYTTNYAELGGGKSGYVLEGVQAYVYAESLPSAKPIYRYYNSASGDHFYTTNYAELGGGALGYVLEGIAGYGR